MELIKDLMHFMAQGCSLEEGPFSRARVSSPIAPSMPKGNLDPLSKDTMKLLKNMKHLIFKGEGREHNKD